MSGEIPSYTVYEDDIVKVFLDINPSTNGDLLVVPKKHVVDISDINDEVLAWIFKVTRMLYPKLREALQCDGLTLVQNNGYGQDVKHFHLHLTPRYENDQLKHTFNKELLLPIEEVFQKLQNL